MRKSPAKPKDIGASLFGKGRRKVLGVLFSRPEQPMYLREIIGAKGRTQSIRSSESSLPLVINVLLY